MKDIHLEYASISTEGGREEGSRERRKVEGGHRGRAKLQEGKRGEVHRTPWEAWEGDPHGAQLQ